MPLPDDNENIICIRGAREHNLKNLSLAIPRDKFVVITGVSGSGKSTLAFDLLFAEGQRRFLDSMNVYTRQFVDSAVEVVGRAGDGGVAETGPEVAPWPGAVFSSTTEVGTPPGRSPRSRPPRDGGCASAAAASAAKIAIVTVMLQLLMALSLSLLCYP